MINIIIDNVYAKLENIPQDIELKIWEKLSYEIKEFQCEYIQIRHLYNRKTKKTYTGLLNYVFEILSDNNLSYNIIDNRTIPQQNADFSLQDFISTPDGNKIPLKARDYQQKIIDEADNREIIRAATGAGKTFIMAGLIDKFKVNQSLSLQINYLSVLNFVMKSLNSSALLSDWSAAASMIKKISLSTPLNLLPKMISRTLTSLCLMNASLLILLSLFLTALLLLSKISWIIN